MEARDFGECIYRMAYVQPTNATNFTEYLTDDVYLISIPVSVTYNDTFDKGTSINKRDNFCSPLIENCSEKGDDWTNEKRHFIAFGWTAWYHALNGFNILSFFPVAVTFAKL